jgi:hypothetical protein
MMIRTIHVASLASAVCSIALFDASAAENVLKFNAAQLWTARQASLGQQKHTEQTVTLPSQQQVGAQQAQTTAQQNSTAVWVGPGQQYSSVNAAIAAAPSGGTVYVAPGTYTNDFSSINKNLIIDGVGGMPHLQAVGQIPNGKAIFITNGNITIQNLELSGATVADGNGAAIRAESGNLTVDRSYIHNNQDGILTASDPNATVTVTNSEFAFNGAGDGYTHGIYAGHIASLTVKNSYFHDTQIGHQIKSRANVTDVEGNYIADGSNGSASYSIDVPNGGTATVKNNVIEKGPNKQNPYFVAFGEEGASNPNNKLTVANNTFVNDSGRSTIGVWNASGTTATIDHNSFYLVSSTVNGAATVTNSQTLTTPPAMKTPTNHQGVTLITGTYGPTGNQ